MLGEEQECKWQRKDDGEGFEQMVLGELYQLPLSKTCPWCSQVSYQFFFVFMEGLNYQTRLRWNMMFKHLKWNGKNLSSFQASWLVHETQHIITKEVLKTMCNGLNSQAWHSFSALVFILPSILGPSPKIHNYQYVRHSKKNNIWKYVQFRNFRIYSMMS
jgi:hypothetical protein